MKPIRTEAIVLRRTNYGEADRIIQLLTPQHGKIAAMAKGVRREKSKLAGGIELLAITEVNVQPTTKSDVSILTGARLHTFFVHILKDYDRMQLAYDILKRISSAVELVPEPEWYFLTKEALSALNDEKIPKDLVELWYRLQYTHLLGHGLNLRTDSAGGALQLAEQYIYDATEMGLKSQTNGSVTSEHIKLLRLLQDNSPKAVSQVGGIESLISECLWVLRQHDQ
ncbi:MAG TPA: DNA repair protein RecO [Verrucomicrobiae bacterium]|nr:DNA repair protein RecO [Verrucomicrobiae bacterium]